ncbi:histidine--tRNA ligase [Candidatus Saccharibacteria bacterium]|nr:histidine--tRNA ligase [Candidatus Saccharibacteria bacterium]MBQ69352.1 histidine--tRNA ligase [Candidatus Saccharibacteria bacterium]|tara:strand:- start:357 stop:1640 length:1284 start_codon:yes stop_codon:yes gene_type:complete
MNPLSSQPYKGTRDYYPEDKYVQTYIFDAWRRVVERFGYQEYGAPILEPLDVYAAKSGQELVNEQTYTFTDRGGRTVAIRPEMTPTISRMVAARRQELAYPARLYSIANFMRYERPQRGREREFWQLNVDLFGADTLQADAEIIAIADAILRELGGKPSDYVIKVNNRQFIRYMLAQYLGLDEVQGQQMMKLLDRRAKMLESDFYDQAQLIFGAANDDRVQKLRDIIEAQDITHLSDDLKHSDALQSLAELLELLRAQGVSSVVFDPTLMRGLDYYTGTVFEVFDTHPDNNRSLFGGGRYDGLVGLFGAEPISAVGMAPGSTMIENFLQVRGLIPTYAPTTDLYVVVIGDVYEKASSVASALRAKGLRVELDVTQRKLDKQLKTALKKQIPYVLFIGKQDEEQFTLKDLRSETEHQLSVEDIVRHLA